ncbi:MAG TPA: GGDEF domain-containing protein [Gammaproteobacteria bacterium]|nr:GGDEF domain-containing protein [Gammaproteobacteria bacterium]
MADNEKTADKIPPKNKLHLPRTYWIGLYSYALLIILVSVSGLLGWYRVTTISTIGLGAGIIFVNALIPALLFFKLDKRLRDHQLGFMQCLLAIMVVAIALFYIQASLRPVIAIMPLLWLISQQSNLTSRRLAIITATAIITYLASNLDILLSEQPILEKLQPLLTAFVLVLIYSSFAFSLRFIKRIRRLSITQQRELQTLRRQLSDLALQDPLTNAYKRSFILRLLEQEKARVDRHGATFSVCLFKIGDMESINKTAGYTAGDQVLRHVAENLLGTIRKSDNLGRYRGCYFLALLPATAKQGAYEFAERAQTRIGAKPAATIAGEQTVALAIGVAEYKKGESAEALIQRLEKALEQSASTGERLIREA